MLFEILLKQNIIVIYGCLIDMWIELHVLVKSPVNTSRIWLFAHTSNISAVKQDVPE